MKTERFFSERQIEEYFAPRLSCMTASEIRSFLNGFCKEHKVLCCGSLYTEEDLVVMFTS